MRSILIIFLACLLLPWSLHAGITGKIAGRVLDSSTGEPLPGANVIIVGTVMGAATDIDGYYYVLNIPVGTYEVQATVIGYEPLLQTEVKVSVDLTTTVDFSLKPTVIEVTGVTITAERPLIIRDATATTHLVTGEEIDRQPVRAFTDVVSQQAGVVESEGGSSQVTDGLHLRGGRGDEVAYMVDGMSAQDRLTGRSDAAIDINIAAVEEVAVITGGFNAEYGQAMSGVVNVLTKEGKRRPEGMLKVTTDKVGDNKNDRDILEVNVGGPFPLFEKVSYFLSGEASWRDHVQTWDFADEPFEMSNTDREFYSLQGKFTYRITPRIKLNLSGFLSRTQRGRYGMFVGYANIDSWTANSLKYAPPEYRYSNFRKAYQLMGTFTHQINPTTFYEMKAGRFHSRTMDGRRDTEYEKDRSWWEDMKILPWWTDDADNVGIGTSNDPAFYAKDEDGNYYYPYGVPIAYAFRMGSAAYGSERISAYDGVKFDLTSQVTKRHQLKLGVDGKIMKAKRWSAQYVDRTPSVPILDVETGEELGVEVPPEYREVEYALYSDEYDYEPKEFAAYVQDKIEYPGFVVNLGVRFDRFDPATWRYNELHTPYRTDTIIDNGDTMTVPVMDTVTATPKNQVSPRFGISFPISEFTVFHISYGHFFQVAQLRWLYDSHNIDLYTYPGGWPIVANPDLQAQKTVQYEIGVAHQFTPEMAINVTSFYKDIHHLIGTKYFLYRPIPAHGYTVYQTEDYGNVMGIEFVLRRRARQWLSGHLAYSLQYARGTSSYVREGYYEYIANIMPDPVTGEPLVQPKIDFPLEFNVTHKINTNIDLLVPEGFGPSIGNVKPFENIDVNLLAGISSGLPYTLEDSRGQRIGEVNAEQMPWKLTADLKAVRRFKLFALDMSLFVQISNLFNRKNVENVYPQTGKPDDNGFIQDFTTYLDQTWQFGDVEQVEVGSYQAADERRDLNGDGEITQKEWYDSYVAAEEDLINDPYMYNDPRRINVGLSIVW